MDLIKAFIIHPTQYLIGQWQMHNNVIECNTEVAMETPGKCQIWTPKRKKTVCFVNPKTLSNLKKLRKTKIRWYLHDLVECLCSVSLVLRYNGIHYKQLHGTATGRLFLLLSQKLWCNTWRNAPLQLADKRYRFGYATLTTHLPPFTKTKLTLSTTTSTNRTPTSSLPKKSKKMENFLFQTFW